MDKELDKVEKSLESTKGQLACIEKAANLEALLEEMFVLTQKVKKADFYYHQMAKFKSLQMEHAFAKAKLLMH